VTAWHDVGVKIDYTGPSFTVNALGRMGHHERARLVKAWRDPVMLLVRQPQLRWRAPGPVGIEVRSWCRADADRGAYFPAAKAMVDGLNDSVVKGVRVHTGWWPDDDGRWVEWEKHYVPQRDMKLPQGLVRVELEVVVL